MKHVHAGTRNRRAIAVLVSALLALAGLTVASAPTGPVASAAAVTPIRAAYGYNWFPETEGWATQFVPALGKYDSSNQTILATHVAMAKYAGLDAFISSWWGQGTKTDQRLPLQLDAARAQGFKITPYYEPASNTPAPTPAQLNADFTYLAARAAGETAWLNVGGKPVLFVYNTGTEASCAGVARLVTASAGRFYVQAKVFSGYASCPTQPDSWHQYGPATPYGQHGTFSSVVSPGFWKFNETAPRLARDLARFKADLARQVASGTQWQLVTTFSEWGEGSSVEPATQWQSPSGMGEYLDAMRAAYLGSPPPPTTSSTTPTTTSTTTSSTSVPTSTSTITTTVPTSTSTTTTSTSISTTSTPPTTTTPPAGTVTIAAAGDIACATGSGTGTSSCAYARTADLLVAMSPLDAVLTLGDNQYEAGALTGFNSQYAPSWGRVKAKTYPSPGNHDWGTPNAQGYRDYFGTGVPAPVRTDRLWYSFDIGGWHFISLDSNCSKIGGCAAGNPEYEFLKADLLANPGKPTIVYWHHPRFANGTGDHGDNAYLAPMFNLLVADRDVQLQINGHVHRYLRYAPMGATGPDPAGLRILAVGTGGKDHSGCGVTTKPGLEVQNCTTYGVLRLTLNADGSLAWAFVPAAGTGTFTDSGTQARR